MVTLNVIFVGLLVSLTAKIGESCDTNYRNLVCKPEWTNSPGKILGKWLQKMRKNPYCLITRYEDDFKGPEEVREAINKNLVEIYFTVGGEKHGVSVSYIDKTKQCMSTITVYRRNVEVGPRWDLSMGHPNPLLAKTVNMDRVEGWKVWGGGAIYNNSIWLYPDLNTLLVGDFENNRLVEGKEAKVSRVRCKHGVMEIDAAITSNVTYSYDTHSETALSSSPTLQDPYETKTVQLGLSELGGEGLFARTFLPKDRLISFFHGIKIAQNTLKNVWLADRGLQIHCDIARQVEYVERSSYIIALDKIHDLDMPPDIGANSTKYNATLGHKVNHAFFPNTFFGWAVHPRFGSVRGLFTLEDIKKGEEVTVHYGYNYHGEDIPQWYRELYDKTFN